MKKTNYNIFLETVYNVFLGCKFQHENVIRDLNLTMLSTSDLLRFIDEPKTPFEMYLKKLPESFKAAVRSELYRADVGWLARSKDERRVLQFTIEGKTFLIPILSDPVVGIDSSGSLDSKIIIIAFYDNYRAAIKFLEKNLHIPKSKNPVEFRWNKLDPKFRQIIHENIEVILKISCTAVFVINTNFINVLRKMNTNIFINIIDGCFTGYDLDPIQNIAYRSELKQKFFSYINNTPTHCDSDFLPLRPERVVRLLVRTLSKYKGEIQDCVPLYAPLTSEESQPIPVTDLLAGVIKLKLTAEENPPVPFYPLYYNSKKLSKKYREAGVYVKAYCWLNEFS